MPKPLTRLCEQKENTASEPKPQTNRCGKKSNMELNVKDKHATEDKNQRIKMNQNEKIKNFVSSTSEKKTEKDSEIAFGRQN